MEFMWSVQDLDNNETMSNLQGRDSSDDLPAHFLLVDPDVSTQRVYRCVATNAIGQGPACEIKVDGKCRRRRCNGIGFIGMSEIKTGYLSWWQLLDPLMLYILIGVAVAVVLLIIIVIIVCCCCCGDKKKGNDAKKKGLFSHGG